MTLSFYTIPGISEEYRDIVLDMGAYLSSLSSLDVTIKDIMPSFASDMVIEIPPFVSTNADAMAPNYVTFSYGIKQSGTLLLQRTFFGFVIGTDFSTPGTIRVTIRCDIVSTFALPQMATVNGVFVKSTVARMLETAAAHYAVPADFSVPPAATSWAKLTSDTIVYRIVTTVQCYLDNDWPAADGEAFQVTCISYGTYTAGQIARTDSSAADDIDCLTNPKSYYDGLNNYTVTSTSRLQFVPAWMLPSVPLQNDGLKDAHTPAPNIAHVLAFRGFSNSAHGPITTVIGNTAIENLSTARAFIGNRHVRIPLPDIHIKKTGTLIPDRDVARLVTFASFDGFHCEMVADTVTDLSALFNAPYSYNNDSEMAYAAGDSRAISLVGSAVSGAVGIIGGTAMLATGNPMGIAGIASAGVGIAGAVNAAQYRGREVVSPGSPSAITELDRGILYVIMEEPANANARGVDAMLDGYACQVTVNGTLAHIVEQMPTDDPDGLQTFDVFEAFRLDDGVRATCGSKNGMPYVPAWVLREYENILRRGCRMWCAPSLVEPGYVEGVFNYRGGTET